MAFNIPLPSMDAGLLPLLASPSACRWGWLARCHTVVPWAWPASDITCDWGVKQGVARKSSGAFCCLWHCHHYWFVRRKHHKPGRLSNRNALSHRREGLEG